MTETAATEPIDRRSATRGLAERILVLAPTGDDATLVEQILKEHERDVAVVDDLGALIEAMETAAGAAVIASEAFEDSEGCGRLRQTLERQEPWSDIPVLLLGGTGEAEAARVTQLLGKSSHVLILERPLAMATFLSAIDAALRTRRRQYEVRRLLTELAASAADIARVHHEANRAKDEFIATLAHELRSPIAAISGWIQMLKMADLASTDAGDALSMIESSAKVQAHIIEDLMDVSRIVAGKVMIEPG
ncbi:MAG: hypothetical protein LC732_04500, partial [Acidobacteria bacterium]|nr:hypothetical protein [Acidobacteriota bacterium]